MSPVRAAKYEPTIKSSENLPGLGKRVSTSPAGVKTTSRCASPSKTMSTKSKENVSPTSKMTSPGKARNSNKIQKSPIRTPKRSFKAVTNTTKKPSSPKMQNEIPVKETVEGTTSVTTTANEPAAVLVTQPTEEQTEVRCEDKVNAVRTVGRKALTTSNLLSAIKKRNMADDKADDKKELSHTDTSRSLPISICGTGMTESAVTLIRTTTEPALAPVQPELISEIRSAINDVRNVDETQLTKTVAQNSPLPEPPLMVQSQHEISSTEDRMKNKRASPSVDRRYSPSPQHSPSLKHVTAIAEIKKPKPEISNDEKSVAEGEKNGNRIDKSLNVIK